MPIDVKICGINSIDALDAAVAGGAKMLGFVFFAKSPRVVTRDEARALLARVPDGVLKVALLVNPNDFNAHSIGRELPFDIVQLHGDESVERVAEIKSRSSAISEKAGKFDQAYAESQKSLEQCPASFSASSVRGELDK